MSSGVLAAVQSLRLKAEQLKLKGHLLRAAENFGRAAEVARALGADNLVTLRMQLRHGHLLLGHSLLEPDASTDASNDARVLAQRAEGIALLFDAVEVLRRRRLADTLLPGKCAAAEEAWSAFELRHNNAQLSATDAASWALLVGYKEFLRAAKFAITLFLCARQVAAECSDAQFCVLAQHVEEAIELMLLPRHPGGVGLGVEGELANGLRNTVDTASSVSGLAPHLAHRLAGAWERLQRSGVLQTRHIEKHSDRIKDSALVLQAKVIGSQQAPGLRTCALDGCGAREAHPEHFKRCAACRAVVYCCREHQVADWPAHKKACKAARKAAAAADEAGPSGA